MLILATLAVSALVPPQEEAAPPASMLSRGGATLDSLVKR